MQTNRRGFLKMLGAMGLAPLLPEIAHSTPADIAFEPDLISPALPPVEGPAEMPFDGGVFINGVQFAPYIRDFEFSCSVEEIPVGVDSRGFQTYIPGLQTWMFTMTTIETYRFSILPFENADSCRFRILELGRTWEFDARWMRTSVKLDSNYEPVMVTSSWVAIGDVSRTTDASTDRM